MADVGEDKSLWTLDRLQDEVAALLPQRTILQTSFEDSTCVLRLVHEDDNKLIFEVEHFDQRQALFEVYGRLWLGSLPSTNTAWSPTKPRPTPEAVTRFAISREPDPEDLDPSEIASVYEKSSF